jgi:glycosyltransferase involved in cell wall biosynthesis
MKKVSVIIPYNVDRGYLNQAVESVKRQTYKGDIELILSQSDNGVSYNINRGIERATGDFIKFFAEDDLLTPNCIEDSVNAIKDFDFIHGKAFNFHEQKPSRNNTHTPRVKIPKLNDMLINNVIHGGTLFYRREMFGQFDESLWTGEEYDFNMMLLSQGAKIGYVDKVVFNYRLHDLQKSIGKHTLEYKAKRKEAIKSIKNRYR